MPSADRLDEIEAEIEEIERLITEKESEAATLYDGAAVAARARIGEIQLVLDRLKLQRIEIAATAQQVGDAAAGTRTESQA